jgi:lipopolysaccharide/colanic/teichoic acid biosynthesis glycosyltransferase
MSIGSLMPLLESPKATSFSEGARRATARGLPRWFDFTAAAFGLSLLAPFLALIWLLIRLDSPGPALFRQIRIGRQCRPFDCFKFRTMAAIEAASVGRIEDFESFIFSPAEALDPRLTRLGRTLRRTSMDELPQLLNVVAGDMALVGPRPELPEIVTQYPSNYHGRHAVLPGVTGEAQVTGRSDLTYEQTMACDLRYVASRSPSRDILILWRTIGAVRSGAGAR